MRKILLLLMLCVKPLISFCQQDPLQSQYLFNPFIINPAYAGLSKDLSALAAYRLQWAGYDGAPVTMNASGHVALRDNRMGLGLIVLKDKIGTDMTAQVLASYAYHLQMTNNRKVSFGLRGGVANYKLDYSSLTIDDTDPKFQGNTSELKPSFGAGVIFSSDNLYASFSVPNMLQTTTAIDGVLTTLYNRHAYVHISYVLPLSSRLKIKPFLLACAVEGSPVHFDLGAALSGDDSYSLGVFSRGLNTYGFFGKVHVGDMLRLGYVFELPTNKSVGVSYPTHEFTVGIRMKVFSFHDIMAVTDF
jgi:type IX secretion system PorP/SprF family membrane protein